MQFKDDLVFSNLKDKDGIKKVINDIEGCYFLMHLWNEIYKTLRYKYDTIVISKFCTFADYISDVVSNIL